LLDTQVLLTAVVPTIKYWSLQTRWSHQPCIDQLKAITFVAYLLLLLLLLLLL
jgi:hypothetical protein